MFLNRRRKDATLGGTTFFSIVSLSFVNFIWIWAFSIDSSANEIFILVLLVALTLLPVRWHLLATCAFLLNVFLLSWIAYAQIAPDGRTAFVTQQIILALLMCGISLIIYRLRKAYEWEQQVSAQNYKKVVQINEGLNNRNAHLESLARMVSHNLRSPISGMKMLLSLYDRQETQEQKEELVSHFKEGAEELFKMVEDLARIMLDYRELIKDSENISLDEIGTGVLQQLQGMIKEYGADVTMDFSDYPTVTYSKVYLESIFINMISNALKYHSPDRSPKVQVSSYLDGDRVILSFNDNGMGIDLEAHGADLFKMYKTFHNQKKEASKGIGLFMTKNQVETRGGKIEVESKVGVGTTFLIQLYRI